MEWIKYHEAEKVFDLRTEHSTYQMQVREYDTLVHLYYGSPVGDTLITDRIVCVDRGFSENPYEAGMDKSFSLDTLPQEYTAYGNGDYRINGLEIEQADGSETANLKFESYEIRKGKYSLKGLPAMFAGADEAETLEIVLSDRASGLKTNLLYGVFPHLDVITRAVRLENTGTAPVTVKKAMSVEMDYEYRELDAVHFYGRHNMERQMERVHLGHGNWSVGSIRGTSSHHHNPFVILCDRNTEENHGECYGYALAYSGNFAFETEVDQIGHTRVAMGIHPYHFAWILEEGECFETPEVIMAHSAEGFGKLSRIYHDAYRSNLIRSKYTEQPRPILANNWEATYFDFDADKIYHIAEEAKNIGLDMFVLDDGWFGKRDNDWCALGDWEVNEEIIKGGLPALAEKIHGIGLKFGLWVEPEMISEDSDLYREHPDWALKIPGRAMNRSRHQLNLDIIDRLKIQYGTSFGYPVSSMGAHVSVCPNHQSGRITPFETRGIVASAGTFGYELDLMKMSEEEKKTAREQILKYKEMEHLVQSGDYYRLVNPFENNNHVLWQFVSKDKKETVVCGVRLHSEANPYIYLFYPQGLDAEMKYEDVATGKRYTGAALMKAGLPLPLTTGDYQQIRFVFKAVEK